MGRWRFLRSPRWIVGTVLVVALVTAMVNLGLWQLRRLDEKRTVVDAIAARTALPPAEVADLTDPGDPFATGGDVEFRRVTATGRYDADGQVAVRNRSQNGISGSWVLTPLVLDDGSAVAVVRGFVALRDEVPAPPAGEVTVSGLLRPTQERGRFGPQDPADGTLDDLARVDLARLEQQLPHELHPAWISLTDQAPPPPAVPAPIPPPVQDEGPHLSYAVQWFIFSTIAAGGWILLIVRQGRRPERPAPAPPPRRQPVGSQPSGASSQAS